MTPGTLIARVVLLALILTTAWPAWGQQQSTEAPVDPARVREAIRKGVAYIYSKQKPDGSWEEVPKRIVRDPSKADQKGHENYSVTGGQWGGQTALATYALLAAGESPQDERIQKAINWLRQADIKGVYALGMRAQIWQYLPRTAETLAAARRDWALLAQGMRTKPGAKGLGTYDYLVDTTNTARVDLSVSQYGVLGAWSLAQAGVEVPSGYWRGTQTAWIGWQQRDGGWAYGGTPDKSHPVNLPITAAGVATLFITQDYLHANEGLRCQGNITNKHIDAGLKLITDNIDQLLVANQEKNRNPYYTLYGIERIGVASGLKYFGSTDWYQLGARWLLQRQNQSSGAWNTGNTSASRGGFCDNAFALIFLARGSAPVVINKLQYSVKERNQLVDGHWNQRPRDIANVVRWLGASLERDLNWQVVNLQVQAADLLDAPILYIAGDQRLDLTPEDEAKLKDYVEQGGLIVGHADCSDRKFQDSFRQLGAKLFNSEFRELPDDHILYNNRFRRSNMKTKPRWQGLSNGARELMVLIPDDPARAWQVQAVGGNESGYQMMMNLLLYAVDTTGAQTKGVTHVVRPNPRATAKSTIKVGRLQYPGQWDPEPGGWRRMHAILLNERSIGLDVQPIDPAKDAIPTDMQVLHMTGSGPFSLSQEARDAIRSYVESGGTLVIDAAGGASAFRTSVEQMLSMLFPAEASQLERPLKPDHALFSAAGKLGEVRYRMAALQALGSTRDPRVRGIEIDGRLAVIVSHEDLSVGMVGMPIDGIVGYEPQTATNIMKSILVYASQAKK